MSDFNKTFEDYKKEGYKWITLATGDYYPDILKDACNLYQPVLELFKQLLKASESTERLLLQINETKPQWMRIQLMRVFRKYVCPVTPVEMLKKKTQAESIIRNFGDKFRPVVEVQEAFDSRPMPDEVICALLWEYKDRGQKGYDLTERLFDLIEVRYPMLTIHGPKRAGKDVLAKDVFGKDYPYPNRPLDFLLKDSSTEDLLAVGLARYDSDRGGAQEDDRTGGYFKAADELLNFAKNYSHQKMKVIFINDGPGLLLGSMWSDYARLEREGGGKILVSTLRMLPERLNYAWLIN